MSDFDKLATIQALLCLFGERYIHVDDAQALHDCKYRRDDLVNSYNAIMAIIDDFTASGTLNTKECA